MKRVPGVLVLFAACLLPGLARGAAQPDPYLWLENVTGKKALAWVARQNSKSVQAVAKSAEFRAREARFLGILTSKARIPYVSKIGGYYYNLWTDAQHERGLWRRTTLEEYRKSEPAWETVLDLDSLSAAEHVKWVWGGLEELPPAHTRGLLTLSRGGSDASVTREFDLVTKTFVKGGFELPESKSSIGWRDSNHVFVGPATDSTTMTTSGYPRVAKLWTRGTPLDSAKVLYEGERGDVAAGAYHDFTPGFERDFLYRSITFEQVELSVFRDGRPVKVDKPLDAQASTWREWLLLHLRTPWTVGGTTYPADALLAARLDDYLAGKRDLAVLFEPTATVTLEGYSPAKNVIFLSVLDDVKSRVFLLEPAGGAWKRTPLRVEMPEFASIGVSPVDPFEGDDFWAVITEFVTPTTLCLGTGQASKIEKLKQQPAWFDAAGLRVSQHFAVSKDGTRIPYFEVGRADRAQDGSAPTLLGGYGGFEISSLPYYSGISGSGWLERGGTYVLANIRGGAEYGPRWHQAAVKAERHHAYEDFIAVALDLVHRKVTSPAHLGCIGGSNGGLLVGNMLTMRPDLFGAVVCEAPLLDMRRYHKLLAGASWMGEYGNPDDPAEWKFIRTWSPYQNVKPGVKYPPVLFTSSTRDDRVHPGHARKMVAKLAALRQPVLYYENVEGGHAGAATDRQLAFMTALSYTFLWQHLGPPPKTR